MIFAIAYKMMRRLKVANSHKNKFLKDLLMHYKRISHLHTSVIFHHSTTQMYNQYIQYTHSNQPLCLLLLLTAVPKGENVEVTSKAVFLLGVSNPPGDCGSRGGRTKESAPAVELFLGVIMACVSTCLARDSPNLRDLE